jgi:hypothetical protein
MFNAEKPSLEDLPSSAQLLRSTIVAALSAIVILVTVVLPAEYGIDPTGVGRVLGLKEMGEIKRQLSEEAARDHGADLRKEPQSMFIDRIFDALVGTAHAQESTAWTDKVSFDLAPGDTHELKLKMKKGDAAEFHIVVEGGRVNFDLHAHGRGQSITYKKGRGSTGSNGQIVAAFDGEHGWFWRNRDKTVLTVTVQLRGKYSKLKEGN